MRSRRTSWLGALAGVLALGAAPAVAESITGLCPDGSVFIVQRASAIPCKEARLVEPHEVPPMRPEYLPRPYNWQVYNEIQDPNNPYNLVESARKVREMRGDGPPPGLPGTPPAVEAAQAPAQPAIARSFEPQDLGLSDGELRDLFLIVELSQDHAPAAFVQHGAEGVGELYVALAHSAVFERRLHAEWDTAPDEPGGGPVLLFSAVARDATEFHGNLTFVQGHLTFHPQADDARQMGVLQGRLGALGADEAVLGYVVLPRQLDPQRSMDIYWDDRRLRTTLAP